MEEVQPQLTKEQEMIKKGFELKEQGNAFFKEQKYQKALSKYAMVELYTRGLASQETEKADADPIMGMMAGKMSSFKVSAEDKERCQELQASTFLNMSLCHFLKEDYQKSLDKAEKSLGFKKTPKAYYRIGVAHKALKHYSQAVDALKKSISMDTNSPK